MKSRDPCDALLHEWAASTPEATVKRFVAILTEMERIDVVERLKDYVHGNEKQNIKNNVHGNGKQKIKNNVQGNEKQNIL